MVSAGQLSVLFMILGIGTFLDVKCSLDITLSDTYWQLSRAAFCLEPLVDSSTTYTIQALVGVAVDFISSSHALRSQQLMAAYIHMAHQ